MKLKLLSGDEFCEFLNKGWFVAVIAPTLIGVAINRNINITIFVYVPAQRLKKNVLSEG